MKSLPRKSGARYSKVPDAFFHHFLEGYKISVRFPQLSYRLFLHPWPGAPWWSNLTQLNPQS